MTKNLWQPVPDRSKKYLIVDNVLSAVVHGIGFGLAVAGLVILIVHAAHTGNALRVTSFSIYGSCMLLLYLFFHPLPQLDFY